MKDVEILFGSDEDGQDRLYVWKTKLERPWTREQ